MRENLRKDPIKVKSEQSGPDGDLGTSSRLNYSKIYTVEHYVRVRNIGMVDKSSIEALKKSSFVKPKDSPEKPRKHPPRNDQKGDDNIGRDKRRDARVLDASKNTYNTSYQSRSKDLPSAFYYTTERSGPSLDSPPPSA